MLDFIGYIVFFFVFSFISVLLKGYYVCIKCQFGFCLKNWLHCIFHS